MQLSRSTRTMPKIATIRRCFERPGWLLEYRPVTSWHAEKSEAIEAALQFLPGWEVRIYDRSDRWGRTIRVPKQSPPSPEPKGDAE